MFNEVKMGMGCKRGSCEGVDGKTLGMGRKEIGQLEGLAPALSSLEWSPSAQVLG